MKNKKVLIASLLGVATLAAGTSTFAYQGNPDVANDNCTDSVRQAAVNEMFENADYDAFQDLFADKGVTNRVSTEDAFLSFVALRNAQIAGDTATADSIKAELGLGQRKQDGSGNGMGKKSGNHDGSGQGRGQGRNK